MWHRFRALDAPEDFLSYILGHRHYKSIKHTHDIMCYSRMYVIGIYLDIIIILNISNALEGEKRQKKKKPALPSLFKFSVSTLHVVFGCFTTLFMASIQFYALHQ